MVCMPDGILMHTYIPGPYWLDTSAGGPEDGENVPIENPPSS